MLGYYLITVLHVLVCVILILVVLLQSGKGADLASAFGGAATQTAFGSRGPASFLSKMTTAAAIVFMVTCLALSLMRAKTETKSIMDGTAGPAAPVSTKAPVKGPATPPPTPEQIKRMQEEIEAKAKQAASGAQAKPVPMTSTPAEQGARATVKVLGERQQGETGTKKSPAEQKKP